MVLPSCTEKGQEKKKNSKLISLSRVSKLSNWAYLIIETAELEHIYTCLFVYWCTHSKQIFLRDNEQMMSAICNSESVLCKCKGSQAGWLKHLKKEKKRQNLNQGTASFSPYMNSYNDIGKDFRNSNNFLLPLPHDAHTLLTVLHTLSPHLTAFCWSLKEAQSCSSSGGTGEPDSSKALMMSPA